MGGAPQKCLGISLVHTLFDHLAEAVFMRALPFLTQVEEALRCSRKDILCQVTILLLKQVPAKE